MDTSLSRGLPKLHEADSRVLLFQILPPCALFRAHQAAQEVRFFSIYRLPYLVREEPSSCPETQQLRIPLEKLATAILR